MPPWIKQAYKRAVAAINNVKNRSASLKERNWVYGGLFTVVSVIFTVLLKSFVQTWWKEILGWLVLALVSIIIYNYEQDPTKKRVNKIFWPTWIILFLVCTCLFASQVTRHHIQNTQTRILSQTNAFFSNSNSFLHGRIGQLEKDNQKLEKTIDDNQRDFNETKRAKDAEIQKLTIEKESAQQKVALLLSLPETALLAYTNAISVSGLSRDTHSLRLTINEHPTEHYVVGDLIVIRLEESRQIRLALDRIGDGETPVEGVTIDFASNLDRTNLVLSHSWVWQDVGFTPPRGRDMDNSGPVLKSLTEIKAEGVLTSISGFGAPPLTVSTNLHDMFFRANIIVFAPRVRDMITLNVIFVLK